jgi:hypothetical protein
MPILDKYEAPDQSSLDFGVVLSPIAWASRRPIKLYARCATVEAPTVAYLADSFKGLHIAEVPFATPTMQAV